MNEDKESYADYLEWERQALIRESLRKAAMHNVYASKQAHAKEVTDAEGKGQK